MKNEAQKLTAFNEHLFKTGGFRHPKQPFSLRSGTGSADAELNLLNKLGVSSEVLQGYYNERVDSTTRFVQRSIEELKQSPRKLLNVASEKNQFLNARKNATYLAPFHAQHFSRVVGGKDSPTSEPALLQPIGEQNGYTWQFDAECKGGLFSEAYQEHTSIWNFHFSPTQTGAYTIEGVMWFVGTCILSAHNGFLQSTASGGLYCSGSYIVPNLNIPSLNADVWPTTDAYFFNKQFTIFEASSSGTYDIGDVEIPTIYDYEAVSLTAGFHYVIGFSASFSLAASNPDGHAQFAFDNEGQGIACPFIRIDQV